MKKIIFLTLTFIYSINLYGITWKLVNNINNCETNYINHTDSKGTYYAYRYEHTPIYIFEHLLKDKTKKLDRDFLKKIVALDRYHELLRFHDKKAIDQNIVLTSFINGRSVPGFDGVIVDNNGKTLFHFSLRTLYRMHITSSREAYDQTTNLRHKILKNVKDSIRKSQDFSEFAPWNRMFPMPMEYKKEKHVKEKERRMFMDYAKNIFSLGSNEHIKTRIIVVPLETRQSANFEYINQFIDFEVLKEFSDFYQHIESIQIVSGPNIHKF